MSKDFRRRLFERYTREQLIDMLINEKIKSDNYRTSINNLVKKLQERDKVIEEVRGYIDKVMFDYFETPGLLQILDKVKDSDD